VNLLLELRQEPRLRGRGLRREAEAFRQVFEELGPCQRRVAQLHDLRRRRLDALQRGLHERGLAGSRLADEDGDARTPAQSVEKRGQGLTMLVREEQEPRVWREIEWPLLQAIETFVHDLEPVTAPLSIVLERKLAVVLPQEVQETFVVARLHVEETQD